MGENKEVLMQDVAYSSQSGLLSLACHEGLFDRILGLCFIPEKEMLTINYLKFKYFEFSLSLFLSLTHIPQTKNKINKK